MDGGAWWATVHGVAKSRTQLSDFIQISLAQDTLPLSMRRDVWGESSVSVDCHTCSDPDYLKMYFVPRSGKKPVSLVKLKYLIWSCCNCTRQVIIGKFKAELYLLNAKR